MAMKKITLLGATGSVGQNVLRVLEDYAACFRLVGISAHRNFELLATICRRFAVPNVAISGEGNLDGNPFPAGTDLFCGPDALRLLVESSEADLVVVASSGIESLDAILAGIRLGIDLAIANKEAIVVGGHLIRAALEGSASKILPLDSEHNAIFQCLGGKIDSCFRSVDSLDRIILTASGGPFLRLSEEQLAHVTLTETLKHPNWEMGQKITINSATLANKGLEIMEASVLFQVGPDQIETLVHPQSIVHSLVQFCDGSVLAQLAPPSMTFPIRHCLGLPDRLPFLGKKLDLLEVGRLTFERPDRRRFSCLRLAEEALRIGGAAPCVFNGANDVAVEAFVEHRINFTQIPTVIEEILGQISLEPLDSLAAIRDKDTEVRRHASQLVGHLH